jgi:transcriptional regulator with XRE-family HTH domain
VQGLAFQIKEMRLSRGLTQGELAKKLELGSQSAVARLEDPGYGRMSLQTLLKVAAFFDVAFTAKMAPYSRFLAEIRDVSPKALVVESFETEDASGAIENAPDVRLIRGGATTSATFTIKIMPMLGAIESNPVNRGYSMLPAGAPRLGITSVSDNLNIIDMILPEAKNYVAHN